MSATATTRLSDTTVTPDTTASTTHTPERTTLDRTAHTKSSKGLFFPQNWVLNKLTSNDSVFRGMFVKKSDHLFVKVIKVVLPILAAAAAAYFAPVSFAKPLATYAVKFLIAVATWVGSLPILGGLSALAQKVTGFYLKQTDGAFLKAVKIVAPLAVAALAYVFAPVVLAVAAKAWVHRTITVGAGLATAALIALFTSCCGKKEAPKADATDDAAAGSAGGGGAATTTATTTTTTSAVSSSTADSATADQEETVNAPAASSSSAAPKKGPVAAAAAAFDAKADVNNTVVDSAEAAKALDQKKADAKKAEEEAAKLKAESDAKAAADIEKQKQEEAAAATAAAANAQTDAQKAEAAAAKAKAAQDALAAATAATTGTAGAEPVVVKNPVTGKVVVNPAAAAPKAAPAADTKADKK